MSISAFVVLLATLPCTQVPVQIAGFTDHTTAGSINVAAKRGRQYPVHVILNEATTTRAVIARLDRVATSRKCDTVSFVIDRVSTAGTYVGSLPGDNANVKTTIVATISTPVVAPVTAENIMLMRCRSGIDCDLGHLLVPKLDSVPRLRTIARATNAKRAPVSVMPVQVSVTGSERGTSFNERHLISSDSPETTRPLIGISGMLDPSIFPPDDYSGVVIVAVSGVPDTISLPINVSVRRGPLLPLVLLLVGLALGWLAQFVDQRVRPSLAILARLKRSRQDLVPADVELLQPAIEQCRKAALRLDIETATALSQPIPSRARALVLLREIESSLPSAANDVGDIRKLIHKARQEIRLQSDTRLAVDLDEVINKTAEIYAGVAVPAAESLKVSAATLSDFARAREGRRVETSSESGRGAMLRLAGSMISFLLVVMFVVAGFYIFWAKNSSFGANVFFDHAELIAWGLGTRVALAALPTIQTFFSR